MMKAYSFEYRFHYALYAVLYVLGFIAPWERYTTNTLGQTTTWLTLAAIIARQQWLSFTAASQLLLVFGGALACFGAALRVWGASYSGTAVVQSHDESVLANGPYRHLRNPLSLGTSLNALALTLLMPPTGAIFAIVTIFLLQLRLIGAEERSLSATLGPTYATYCIAVPRIWASLRPRVPAAGDPSHLLLGAASELFVIGSAASLLTLGWRYNSLLVIKGVLISLGVSLIARAFVPRRKTLSGATVQAAKL